MTASVPAKVLTAVIIAGAAASCSAERKTPAGYQGVVEHDDRHLGFRVGGQLKEIHFDRGDVIENGELIAVKGTVPFFRTPSAAVFPTPPLVA
ncbi:MAG: hypothetical protein JSU89_03830 [Myxococcales bacterium]|nr:MAG: hypothetical protein JSU89_03830 [Myxococcales bacterium]